MKKFLILNSVIAGIATPLGLGLQIALPSNQNTSINKDLTQVEQLQTQNVATNKNKILLVIMLV